MSSPATRAVIALAVTAVAVVASIRGDRPPPHIAVGGAAGGIAGAASPAPADPFPIRRVWVPPGQVPVPTDDQPGAWRQLPRDEFERRVRTAAEAQAAARTPPLLVRAEYKAAYEPGRLFGSVAWAIANPGRRTGPLSFDPLKLAVENPKWANGQDALLFHGRPARSDRPGTYLWVDSADGGTVTAGWSVRGVNEADAEQFTLSAPASAITVAEITLPADLRLTTSTPGVVLSGPLVGGRDGRLWRLSFAGRTDVLLAVLKANADRPTPAADRAARYEIAAGMMRATFVFAQPPQADKRDRLFDVDPGLVIDRVSGGGGVSWSVGPDGRLRVRLHPVSTASKLTITATARLGPDSAPFTLPGIRPSEGVAADLIDLSLPPDWKLDGWSAPDYRVTVPGEQADRTFRVQFTGGIVTSGEPTRHRPVVRLRRVDVEYVTDEAVSWAVSPGTTRLTARVKVKVARGPLTALPVVTEPGYMLEKVTLVPDDPTVEFGRQADVPGGWLIEPTRPIGGGQGVEFRLEFRADNRVRAGDPADATPTPTAEPLPRFGVPGAADRQGTITVIAGGGLKTAVRTAGGVTTGGAETDVSYRGREPVGEVRFTPDRVTVAVTGYHLSPAGREWVLRVTGRADESGLSELTVVVPDPAGTVQADGAMVTPLPATGILPLLLANSGWTALAAAGNAADAVGGYWRVSFTRPVRGEFTLTVHLPGDRVSPGPSRPVIPLPRVYGAPDVAAEVTLAPALAATHRVERGPNPGLDRRSNFPAVLLTPRQVDVAPPTRDWQYADLRRTVAVQTDGTANVILTGRLIRAAAGVLTVRLPAGATFDGLTLGERWATPKPTDGVYQCPLPELDGSGLPFEVRYRLPAAGGPVFSRHTVPTPELPGDPLPSHHWLLSAGLCTWPTPEAASRAVVSPVWVFSGFVPIGLGLLFAGLVLTTGFATLTRARGRVALVGQVGTWAVLSRVLPDGWEPVWRLPLTWGLLGLAAGILLGRLGSHVTSGKPNGSRMSAASISVLVLLAGYGWGRTQGVEPVTVYLTGDGDRMVVYASQATLDRLDAASTPPLAGVLITRAQYTGSVDADVARFEATFTLFCPSRGEQQLHLPLAGVRLERVAVDGKETFPEASREGRYTVNGLGPGKHELSVRFVVVPTGVRTVRIARFGGPEVPCTRVSFVAGTSGARPDIPSRQGGQVTKAGPAADADHGSGRAVEVRWWAPNPPTGQEVVRVKEGVVWDVDDATPAVTAAFIYQIDGGTRNRFRWSIPAGLVPVSVHLRAGEDRTESPGVEPWAVQPAANGQSVVDVRLTTAVEGRVTAVLRLVPVSPLAASPLLRFPAAADVPDADRDSVYAVRFSGLAPTGMAIGSAIDYPPDAMTKDFAGVGELNLDKSPPARVLKRTAGGQTDLRPELRSQPGWAGVVAEATYTLGRWQTAEGAFRVTGREFGAFEFDLPPACELRDVRAADLKGWSRTGSRVQVWLARPSADLTVRWAGQFSSDAGHAQLPIPQSLTPAGWPAPITVRVRPATGWVVRPLVTPGLTARGGGAPGEFMYSADRGAAATFQVHPVPQSTKPTEPPKRPPPSMNEPKGRLVVSSPTDSREEQPAPGWRDHLADTAWLTGVVVVVGLCRWGNRRWSPECLVGIGVLGVADTVDHSVNILFALLVIAGLAWRATRWVRSRG